MRREIGSFFAQLPSCPLPWRGSLRATKLTNNPKVFEIYVFSLIAGELLANPSTWRVVPASGHGSPIRQFVFRGGPGVLWGHPDYSFFELRNVNNGNRYELHLGIEIAGSSGETHEIDVVLFEQPVASHVRGGGRSRPNITGNHTPWTIECKYYTNPIEKEVGRECLGIAKETLRFQSGLRGLFITNADDSQVSRMLNYHLASIGHLEPSNLASRRQLLTIIRSYMASL